jgi:succinoglycan biosynthesis protein ExoA
MMKDLMSHAVCRADRDGETESIGLAPIATNTAGATYRVARKTVTGLNKHTIESSQTVLARSGDGGRRQEYKATTLPGASRRARGEEVLAVIPVLNEERHIADCIRSLMAGDERLQAVETVVADGGSTDGTRAIVRALCVEFPNLRLVDNPQRLQSAAVNQLARKAGADRRILVRCDAHALYPPGYITHVADSLLCRGVASVVTPMDAVGEKCFQKANAWAVDTPLGSGGAAHRGGRRSTFVDHGHHAGFDLRIFLETGGYDETFSHNEDAEFDVRLRKAGHRIFLDAEIRVTYRPRASAVTLARQYYNYGRGRARTLMKHGEKLRLRQLVPPATLLACLAALLLSPLSGWLLTVPAAYSGALVAASLVIAVRNRSPCGLLAGVALVIMHTSWSLGLLRQFTSPSAAGAPRSLWELLRRLVLGPVRTE